MIGYYAHHQGDGHVTRAAAIAAALDGEPLTVLSSRPQPQGWRAGWIELARDDAPSPDAERDDVTAGGALHWAPAGHAGLRRRMGAIAAWIDAAAPRAMVVDVSVEVAALARLMGVRTIVMALPGDRRDAAHALAYTMADAVLAPWPPGAGVLRGGAGAIAPHEVGAISRFADRARADGSSAARSRSRSVLVLSGRGGTTLTEDDLAAARAATPGWTWTVLGPPTGDWVDDPWPLLREAGVVVTHAGQNAIADVATARRPAIVLPQPRPYDEQHATAAALERLGLATVLPRWPDPDAWPRLLEAAAARGGAGWGAWTLDGEGARRAAAVVAGVADRELACAPR